MSTNIQFYFGPCNIQICMKVIPSGAAAPRTPAGTTLFVGTGKVYSTLKFYILNHYIDFHKERLMLGYFINVLSENMLRAALYSYSSCYYERNST